MNRFDPQDGEQEEPARIVDLDTYNSSQKRRADVILNVGRWLFARPSHSYAILTFLLLILIGSVFLQYHPLTKTTSSHGVIKARTTMTNLAVTPTPAPPALLELQERSLHIPTVPSGQSCPTTPEKRFNANYGIVQGNAPVYAASGADSVQSPAIFHYNDTLEFANNVQAPPEWGGNKVMWFVDTSYKGPILIRGKQINGSHIIHFSTYDDPNNQPFAQQLVLYSNFTNSPWTSFSAYTLVQAPGCYAYQVDGQDFSHIIIFQAVVQD